MGVLHFPELSPSGCSHKSPADKHATGAAKVKVVTGNTDVNEKQLLFKTKVYTDSPVQEKTDLFLSEMYSIKQSYLNQVYFVSSLYMIEKMLTQ